MFRLELFRQQAEKNEENYPETQHSNTLIYLKILYKFTSTKLCLIRNTNEKVIFHEFKLADLIILIKHYFSRLRALKKYKKNYALIN